MKAQGLRKQVVLFLVAILLPVVVLVALTLRMVRQEKELALKRVADEHQRVAAEISRDLSSRLERLAREEASALAADPLGLARRDYIDPEVVLVAGIEGARLILPWEAAPRTAGSRAPEGDAAFVRILRQAENAEFSEKNHALAAERYRVAASVARLPAEEGYARLQRARALAKSRRTPESIAEYAKVLSLPPDVVDEYGVPLSLFAVTPLLEAGFQDGDALERLGGQLESRAWLSPSGAYMMKDLLETILARSTGAAGASLRAGAEERLRKTLALVKIMEQALGLKEDFPRLGLGPLSGRGSGQDGPRWVSYGQKPWLVGRAAPPPGGPDLLVAVDLQAVSSALASKAEFSTATPADVRLTTGPSSDGTSLGPDFQGLGVAFGSAAGEVPAKQWSQQRLFYFLALAVVLSVTLFGAYLLWRDIRREVLVAGMRSRFVSSVSHELKTPLTAIRMFAETLRLGRARDPAAQAEYLDTIVNESERLTRLLNNVLDFSKIEQGKKIYHLAPASLPEIVRAAVRAMGYPLKQQGFALDVGIDEGLPQVRVDRDAIEQALLNLLSNAMKYSGESRAIGLQVRREGDYALIQVIDRGIGIDPKDQARIFEEFYRAPSPENRALPGTGLGLALVAHIAKAHGGSVRVESRPGQGSTFSIILPLGSEP